MDSKFSLDEINEAAARLLPSLKGHSVIAFHGEMGAGKTTFINAICKQLEVIDTMSSPTFSIINEYRTKSGKTIFHIDLYRLKDEQEAIMAGVEECFNSGHTCFVEWPEKAPKIFPEDTIHCYLNLAGISERKLQIIPDGISF